MFNVARRTRESGISAPLQVDPGRSRQQARRRCSSAALFLLQSFDLGSRQPRCVPGHERHGATGHRPDPGWGL